MSRCKVERNRKYNRAKKAEKDKRYEASNREKVPQKGREDVRRNLRKMKANYFLINAILSVMTENFS